MKPAMLPFPCIEEMLGKLRVIWVLAHVLHLETEKCLGNVESPAKIIV